MYDVKLVIYVDISVIVLSAVVVFSTVVGST
jgi:hypothetical protein